MSRWRSSHMQTSLPVSDHDWQQLKREINLGQLLSTSVNPKMVHLLVAKSLFFLVYRGIDGTDIFLSQWRRGGQMQSYRAGLRIEWSEFEPWSRTLCCVLGQDASLSQCLSPPRWLNGYRRIKCWGWCASILSRRGRKSQVERGRKSNSLLGKRDRRLPHFFIYACISFVEERKTTMKLLLLFLCFFFSLIHYRVRENLLLKNWTITWSQKENLLSKNLQMTTSQ